MVNKHFFKPLLPGFHSHLTIPVAFFSKYIQGTNEQKKTTYTAKLRSDASKITWEVKIEDGQKLTDGWKEFALAHDLRIGDIVIFRQEKDMAFHVTLMGPSCCEIQYESCLDDKSNLGKIPEKTKVKKNPRKETKSSSLDPSRLVANDESKLGKVPKKTKVKKNPRKETKSSSVDPSRLEANVAPSSLRYDTLHFPTSFARENGLSTRCGEIVLMNEKGRSWTLALKQKKCGTTYIRQGWRSFCSANGLKAGDFFSFKLIQRGKTPVLRLTTTESEEEEEEESSEGDEVESLSTEPESNLDKIQRRKKVMKNPKSLRFREAESSSLDPSCFVAKISPAALRYDTLRLPTKFSRENCLDTRCGEIVLMNEKGTSWTLNLKQKRSCGSGTMYIRRGWRSFCSANGLRAGDSITFKLIKRGGTLVLRLSPTKSEDECSDGDEIESLSTEPESDHEEINQNEKSFKKPRSIWKASSSPSQNRFFTLTLRPYNLTKSNLYLPIPFTKFHGINEETKMRLLDKHGVKWNTNLRSENKGKKIRLVGGWKEFFKANCVKIGEPIRLKLIWEGNKSCVLQFCSKVK